jgi:hypothetical protein
MADMMRAAAKLRPTSSRPRARITLVESSPCARAMQRTRSLHCLSIWVSRFDEVPDRRTAISRRQRVLRRASDSPVRKGERGWHERMVTSAGDELALRARPRRRSADL